MEKSGWKESGPIMFRSLARVFTLLAFAALLPAQDTVIRVNVNLVHVIATVRNQSGDLVGALNKSDFEILDNGVRQDIAVFARQSDQPLSVAMLIDTSGSTAKDLKYETESAARFLHVLLTEGQPQDSVALYSFNYDITEQQHFTHNHQALETRLRSLLKNLKGEAGTSLYDAIYYAGRALESRDGRKIIVVITDGGETTSSRDLQQALQAVQLSDAVIYPLVVIPITNDAGRNIGGEHALTIMAERTGGRTFLPSGSSELDKAFTDLLNELRTQYVLGFYPHNVPLTKDRFHRLQVRVKSPELRVSARNGYYGEAEGDSAPAGASISAVPERRKNQEE
jgi:Ca-activated chloride channel family protein